MTVQLKILVVGEPGVGKTSLIRRYTEDAFEEDKDDDSIVTTDVAEKRLRLRGREVLVSLWDLPLTGSPEEVSAAFFAGADGCLIIFSALDEGSLRNVPSWVDTVHHHCNEDIPLLFVQNKMDLKGQGTSPGLREDLVRALADEYELKLFGTSAASSRGVDEAFTDLLQQCLERRDNSFNVARDVEDLPPDFCQRKSWQGDSDTALSPSKRRTQGIKPVFNRHKCSVM